MNFMKQAIRLSLVANGWWFGRELCGFGFSVFDCSPRTLEHPRDLRQQASKDYATCKPLVKFLRVEVQLGSVMGHLGSRREALDLRESDRR